MAQSTSIPDARGQFDNWARDELFDPRHRQGTDILEQAVDIHLERLYLDLALHELLEQPSSARMLGKNLNFSQSAWICLDAMLTRLANRRDLLKVTHVGGVAYYTAIRQPENRTSELPALVNQMQALGENYIAPMEFLEFGAEHFIRSMRDDHTFMDRVLTGQESEFADTWNRATNTDPLQDVHGIMGAKALDLLFNGGTILEVGGGTGNGIRNNLHELDRSGKLPTLEKYVFTDVSMQFIMGTRREFKGLYPSTAIDWRLLNINKDFAKQRLDADCADIVYGVNAAHIAERTVDFLLECRRVLRSCGVVVFAERIRRSEYDMAPREIVLNQSSYHRTAAQRHPDFRPSHAYLAREHWLKACEMAGFSEFEVWPSVESLADYFPDQYAVVVVARL